jgi:predicted DNA-binding protein
MLINMKALSTQVSPELHERLKKASGDTGLKMKAIFRMALEAWLKARKLKKA